MKPVKFLAAFAGLGFVAASPMPTSPSPPGDLQPPDGHKALLIWNPSDAYKHQPRRKTFWEDKCHDALAKVGCGVGIVHIAVSTTNKSKIHGKKLRYVNVEGAPSNDLLQENWKKMRVRVHEDGSYQDGWSARDLRSIEGQQRRKEMGPAAGGQQAVLVWNPPDAYLKQNKRRVFWNEKCQEALTREGCAYGLVHAGERNLTKPNGEKSSYVNVEAAPSLGMEPARKMRVFQDGGSEDIVNWSERDRRLMREAERLRGAPQQGAHLGPSWGVLGPSETLLFWDPADAYHTQGFKKAFWEDRCGRAISRHHGCSVGIIHQGERKFEKPNGEKTTYINVDGASSINEYMTDSKKMRVFEDGSYQDGWSEGDRVMMAASKRAKRTGRPEPPDRAMMQNLNQAKSMDPGEASTSTQGHSTPRVALYRPLEIDKDSPSRDSSKRTPHLRKAYHQACHEALEREGCDFGIIQKEHRRIKNPDATWTGYMNVFAGKHGDLDNARYMRLFENGTSEWYPPGPLPKRVRHRGKKRPLPEHEEGSGAQAPARALTQAASLGRFQAPGGSEGQYSDPQVPVQEQIQDSSKRRRVGMDEYQYSGAYPRV